MKYIKIALIILVLAFMGSVSLVANSFYSSDNLSGTSNSVRDDLKSEVRNVSGFEGVDIGGTIVANVTVGQDFSVVVEAPEEVLPAVITKVENNSLIVKFEKDFWKTLGKKYKNKRVKVTISLPRLNDLDVSGASKATVTGVNSNKLLIDVSGASNVSIEGTAREIEVDLSGASSLKADSLFSEMAQMELSGASSAKVNVTNDLRVEASGASSVHYQGNPRVQKQTSGASSVRNK